jgi:hypothetical protein
LTAHLHETGFVVLIGLTDRPLAKNSLGANSLKKAIADQGESKESLTRLKRMPDQNALSAAIASSLDFLL